MDIAAIVSALSTGATAITVLKQGYDWVSGATFDQRFDRFTKQVTDQLQEIRNGVYRLPIQEVSDTSYSAQRVIQDVRQIGQAVEPIQKVLHTKIALSDSIVTPDKFREAFRHNPEDILFGIRPLAGEPLIKEYSSDPTVCPVLFEKWGTHFIGMIKVGYARDYLNLDYQPLISGVKKNSS